MWIDPCKYEECIKYIKPLRKAGFMSDLPQDDYLKLLPLLKKVLIKAGEVLIQEGDQDKSLYVLIHGRLRVYNHNNPDGIADISSGHLIGEMALLLNENRTSSVRAIRDSFLLKIEGHDLEDLQVKYPEEFLKMAKIALKRMASCKRAYRAGEDISNLAIIPSSLTDLNDFAEKLFAVLKNHRQAYMVRKKDFQQEFSQNPSDQEAIAWFNHLEEKYPLVVFVGEKGDLSWNEKIIRSADRVVLVAHEKDPVQLNEAEEYLFHINPQLSPFIDLVLIHPEEVENIAGTALWLKKRAVDMHHHLKLSQLNHFEKLARFLLGKAFGVVLSGGMARGLGHLGVLRALEELDIPVDYIAGNSMGSIISAGIAAFGLEKSLEINKGFVRQYTRIPTLPIHSILTGKLETKLFQSTWKETRIEDLWTGFFCVASDLSLYQLKVIDTGLVWKALRISTSMPAIFPPIYTSEGETLVDGGILNNLPVDVMRQKLSGGFILAINCNTFAGKKNEANPKEAFTRSGWRHLFETLNPFHPQKIHHSIITLIMKSFYAATIGHQKKMEEMADAVLSLDTLKFSIYDFKNSQKIIDEGYALAKKKLPALLENYLKK